MKATVFTTTYNKDKCIENVMFSLFMQVTDFDWELRVYDDHSPVDPEPVVKKYFPHAYYERLPEHRPFDEMMSYCLGGESEVVVMMSADVILCDENVLSRIVHGTFPGHQAYATVINAKVDKDLYLDFDSGMEKIWKTVTATVPTIRTGQFTRPYFFFGAIMREDLEKVHGEVPWCDIRLNHRMAKEGYKPVFPKKCFAIHQEHPQTTLPCTRIDVCEGIPCWLKKRIKGV